MIAKNATIVVKAGEIKPNPNNPRIVKDEKYKKLVQSIKDFPEMLEIRPIVVNDDMVVLGGNMRLKACKEAGLKEIPIIKASSLSDEKQKEFIIKDNLGYGEWDWNMIANEWNSEELEEWGMDIPGFTDIEDLGESFSLPNGDKSPFQQMTFTLADQQAEVIKNAIEEIKKSEEYKYCETFGNENGNGNALYLLISNFTNQR
ncbi:MAG: ParB N-terminal domain-containing protein [Flavobacterium sp.]